MSTVKVTDAMRSIVSPCHSVNITIRLRRHKFRNGCPWIDRLIEFLHILDPDRIPPRFSGKRGEELAVVDAGVFPHGVPECGRGVFENCPDLKEGHDPLYRRRRIDEDPVDGAVGQRHPENAKRQC